MSNVIINEVVEQLRTLPDNLQQEVLRFTQKLNISSKRGIPGKNLLHFAGVISHEDLEIMRQAIESDCEQVDLNEW
jgi:hypothetical protein